MLPKDNVFEAHKKLIPIQKVDVLVTYEDTSDLEKDFGYKASTPYKEGLRRFA